MSLRMRMRNGAMSELHLARFNAVREFDDYRIISEIDGVDVSNMMSRRDYVRFLDEVTEERLPFDILKEKLEMAKNNKEQENVNNKKRKWNKKKKNEVDYDVSAADHYPGDGSDYKFTVIDINDPAVQAEVAEKMSKVELLIKQYEKEFEEEEEEEKKKMKEEEKKKKEKKKKKKKRKMELKRSGSSSSGGSRSGSSGSSRCSSTISQEYTYPC